MIRSVPLRMIKRRNHGEGFIAERDSAVVGEEYGFITVVKAVCAIVSRRVSPGNVCNYPVATRNCPFQNARLRASGALLGYPPLPASGGWYGLLVSGVTNTSP